MWTLGDRAILSRPLLGFLCSSQCPGDIILRTYDLARSLRDAGVPVIGGFHSPMEKECLDLLLRGSQPVVVCPARSIEGMRVPAAWKRPVEQGRLIVLSPFPSQHRRPTVPLAEKRNRLVAEIAHKVFVAHAAPQSKTADFCRQLLAENRPVWTFDTPTAEPIRSLGARCFPSVQAIVDALSSHTQADGVLG
jgi:predicted Rossmann fold nucleotide-binding protein DprA/Smf involved in DNA uptake